MLLRDREMATQQVLNRPRGTRQSVRQGSSRTRRREAASAVKYEPCRAGGQPKAITGPGILPATSACCQLTVLRDPYLPIVCAGPLRLKLEPGAEGRALTDVLKSAILRESA